MTSKFFVALFVLLTVGCALKERTIEPLPTTFIEDVDIGRKQANLPFDHSWVRPGRPQSDFRKVYFTPVRTDLLPEESWRRSAGFLLTSQQDYMVKAGEIAQYFRAQVIERTREHGGKNPKLIVTNQPGPDTMVVEMALTELEFAHPAVRAASLAAPVPGTGPAVAAMSDPHVAFAARISDGRTGDLIATAADRKFAPARVVDLNKLTVSSSAREIVSLWADSIGEALQGDGFSLVNEKRFELLPW